MSTSHARGEGQRRGVASTPERSPRRVVGAALLALLAGSCAARRAPTEPPPVALEPIPVSDPGSALPEGWQRGVFMEIYVRGYQDSDGDGVGDLRGVIQRLDYLAELGVAGLWLMPVTASEDHDHGYAVADYRAVEPDYGALEDLDALVAAAHARGIGVILDYVLNHSAAAHPAFLRSQRGEEDPFRAWYLWEKPPPQGWRIYGGDPWRVSLSSAGSAYFAGFSDRMPDFNLRNPEVVRWHHDNLRFWLNRGIDGFRFDAVGNLVENGPAAWENQPENHLLLGEVRQLAEAYERRFLVCEAPADPPAYAAASSCGAAFAFGRQGVFVAAARGDRGAILELASLMRAPTPGLVPFASNHDAFAGERLFDQLGGDVALLRLAAATYLLQPGPAFIYYGEEIGLAGAATLQGDARLRTPMSWTGDRRTGGFTTAQPFRALARNVEAFNVAAQLADAGSLLTFYRRLLALRRAVPALAAGVDDLVTAQDQVLHLRRSLGGSHAVIAFNYGASAAPALLAGLPAGAALAPAFPPELASVTVDGQGRATVALPARAVAVFTYQD
ncbi:MAG: alpha-amylase family glycosyl hydrolase [Kofleriaceae bacterium]